MEVGVQNEVYDLLSIPPPGHVGFTLAYEYHFCDEFPSGANPCCGYAMLFTECIYVV